MFKWIKFLFHRHKWEEHHYGIYGKPSLPTQICSICNMSRQYHGLRYGWKYRDDNYYINRPERYHKDDEEF